MISLVAPVARCNAGLSTTVPLRRKPHCTGGNGHPKASCIDNRLVMMPQSGNIVSRCLYDGVGNAGFDRHLTSLGYLISNIRR